MKFFKIINTRKIRGKLILVILLFTYLNIKSQTITPQVINSAGSNWQLTNGITITDNVGEPFTQTIGPANNIQITQGFLQNFIISNTFSFSIIKNDVSCNGKKDGNISLALTTTTSYTANYFWIPQTLCPSNHCTSIDSLEAGTYYVNVKINYIDATGQTKTDSTNNFTLIINDMNGACKVEVFTGITPNQDGINDVFTIKNISDFPNNRLQIYNRWGQLLYEKKGYNNFDNAWPNISDLGKLTGTTYFYILYLNDENVSPIKGWVELLQD